MIAINMIRAGLGLWAGAMLVVILAIVWDTGARIYEAYQRSTPLEKIVIRTVFVSVIAGFVLILVGVLLF